MPTRESLRVGLVWILDSKLAIEVVVEKQVKNREKSNNPSKGGGCFRPQIGSDWQSPGHRGRPVEPSCPLSATREVGSLARVPSCYSSEFGLIITGQIVHAAQVFDDEESIRLTLPPLLGTYGLKVTSASNVVEAWASSPIRVRHPPY